MSIFAGLGHVAIKVKNLDASVAFYEKLGFPEILRLLNDKGDPWIVYHQVSDNVYLELFPGGPEDKVPGPERTGVNHLCLTSADLDATEAALKKVGVALSRPRKDGRGVDGNRGMWIEDPDGNRIEIMEMAPGCIQYQAAARHASGKSPEALRIS